MYQVTVVAEPFNDRADMEAAIDIIGSRQGSAILDSSLATGLKGRFTILAWDPIDEWTLESFVTPSAPEPSAASCPFQTLFDCINAYPSCQTPDGLPLPFFGGWIGFFSYEAGLATEKIVPTTLGQPPIPLAKFKLYDRAIVFDRQQQQWWMTAIDWPGSFRPTTLSTTPTAPQTTTVKQRLRQAHNFLQSSIPKNTMSFNRHSQMWSAYGIGISAHSFNPKIAHDDTSGQATALPNMSREVYLSKVARIKQYVEAGDVYQVNLTQRFELRTNESPLTIYRRLRRHCPSPFAAFLPWEEAAISCASPELFLHMQGSHVISQPIKGTRPRGDDQYTDAHLRNELATSEKDRAELTMIVDLVRNDLGRVCIPGSVRVTQAQEIESHPTVFQQVATVEGNLAPCRNWVDLMRSTFPGGSITGAPKIRAMQIIDELEPTARGVYCGAIGYINLNGSLCLNMAIRTLVQMGCDVYIQAGGGIVADSDPQSEYEELLAKARGAFGAARCHPRLTKEKEAASQTPVPCPSFT